MLGAEMSKIKFDPVINYGHLIQLIGFVTVIVVGYFAMRSDITLLDARMAKVETTLERLALLIITDAKQEERLLSMDRRLDRLERATERGTAVTR